MENNPYQSPVASIGGRKSIGTTTGVSTGVVDIMARTRPWTLFVAILGFIGVGLMLLGAITILATMSQLGAGGIGVFLALIYVGIAGVYALPCVKLMQYSAAITQLRIDPSMQTLEVALDRQRSFWMTVGIMILIGIVLMILLTAISASTIGSTTGSSYSY